VAILEIFLEFSTKFWKFLVICRCGSPASSIALVLTILVSIDAKLKYIRETTLPSQQKRKVSGDTSEVERLLTVFYYESENKRARKSKGHPGDESD
jgi:hypothetical protein